eukprot:15288630-Alexandrium_andersonii.AAC.1
MQVVGAASASHSGAVRQSQAIAKVVTTFAKRLNADEEQMGKLSDILAEIAAKAGGAPAEGGAGATGEAMQEGEGAAEAEAPAAEGGEGARSTVPVVEILDDDPADGG